MIVVALLSFVAANAIAQCPSSSSLKIDADYVKSDIVLSAIVVSLARDPPGVPLFPRLVRQHLANLDAEQLHSVVDFHDAGRPHFDARPASPRIAVFKDLSSRYDLVLQVKRVLRGPPLLARARVRAAGFRRGQCALQVGDARIFFLRTDSITGQLKVGAAPRRITMRTLDRLEALRRGVFSA